MFSFRNPVQEVKKAPKNVYVLTLTKMEGDADHYYKESITFKDIDLAMAELPELITVLKALEKAPYNQDQELRTLQRNPDLIGVSQNAIDRISDMVGSDECGNRHKITGAIMEYYDEFGNKFNGDFYMGEEKIFPMNCW